MRFPKSLLASALLVTLVGGCTDVPDDSEVFQPKGVMSGTVNYIGPLPCSENGHIRGNAVLTLFNVNALPPPAGLGLSAHRIAVVPGDVLFAGVAYKIPSNPDGTLACPDPGSTVEVSAAWEVGPVDPGRYQVRGWFDWDGDWHAAFKFANMVTKGDIGGGAIANLAAALTGKEAVRYTEIEVGIKQDDGKTYRIPENGWVTSNVSPVLAAPITTNRPYFHISQLRRGGDANGIPEPIQNPSDDDIMMPADYQLHNAAISSVHDSLYWLMFQAGLPAAEVGNAMAPPFFFRLEDPPAIFLQRYDANKDGVIDALDHITGTTFPVVALGPIISLTKLDVANDTKKMWRMTQDKPRVLTSLVVTPPSMPTLMSLMSITCPDDFPTCVKGQCCKNNTDKDCKPDSQCFDVPVPTDAVKAYIRPSGVCVEDATDRFSKTVIVTPHEFDQQDDPTTTDKDESNKVISDPDATIKDIAEQLSRDISGVVLSFGCLPPGKFALNVIYPSTGQAWTTPNESGICMPGEAPGGGTCGSRAKLESQFRTLDIGPASDPSYCNGQRLPMDAPDPIRDYCLTPAEHEQYMNGTLWGGEPAPLCDPSGCPGENTECQLRACTSGVCGTYFMSDITPCTVDGNPGKCDGAGACVAVEP